MPSTLWIDVEDLFEYAQNNPRLSGIQRLAFEVFQSLRKECGDSDRIRFLRHDPLHNTFRPVAWSEIADLLDRLTGEKEPDKSVQLPGTDAPASAPTNGLHKEAPARRWVRRLARRLPLEVRYRLLNTARLQLSALKAVADLLFFVGGRALRRRPASSPHLLVAPEAEQTAPPPLGKRDFALAVRPGDVLATFGAPWSHLNYARLIRDTKQRFGLKFAFLAFDVIPIRHPEWCDRGLVRIFSHWFASVMPVADIIFAISHATARDVARLAVERDIALQSAIQVIPIGTGFDTQRKTNISPTDRIPRANSYVLFVSTIEARKNHVLLFRVWRRMLSDMPAASVPTLVFVGRVGWLVDDFMKQLHNCNYLEDRIQVLQNVTDTELAHLYSGCLFTLFPSLYEGWGLPVSESLMFGKPCIASNVTSIPEAGGTLVRYFDPDSVTDAYTVIRATIEDRDGLTAWQNEVVRSFVPIPWSATARTILDIIDDVKEAAQGVMLTAD